MVKKISAAAIVLSFTFALSCTNERKEDRNQMKDAQKQVKPPIAQKIPKELEIHGDLRIDNYYWLNQREDQQVLDYLNAENTYREGVMAHLEDLQEELFQEMKGRIKEKDESVPQIDNGYWY